MKGITPKTIAAASMTSAAELDHTRVKLGKADVDDVRWVAAFDRMDSKPEFVQMQVRAGLYPFALTGDALTRYIRQTVADYNRQARQFKLLRER
jgi:tripartite-type tricarboxylate transporter receptor subunit TctC